MCFIFLHAAQHWRYMKVGICVFVILMLPNTPPKIYSHANWTNCLYGSNLRGIERIASCVTATIYRQLGYWLDRGTTVLSFGALKQWSAFFFSVERGKYLGRAFVFVSHELGRQLYSDCLTSCINTLHLGYMKGLYVANKHICAVYCYE